ncbi:MAG: flagellar assembly protein FliW [Planctomycetota bacterium]|nr:flagellar assembly protein FliW [Planctomycetota bacterium]
MKQRPMLAMLKNLATRRITGRLDTEPDWPGISESFEKNETYLVEGVKDADKDEEAFILSRGIPMLVQTSRFGQVQSSQEEVIIFPKGLIGFESVRHWIIVPDPMSEDVAWIQSIAEEQVALPIISPRKFAPDYKVCISNRQLSDLHIRRTDQIYVFSVVSKSGKSLTMNLRSPVVINLTKRLACQVISSENLPIAVPLDLNTLQTLKVAA